MPNYTFKCTKCEKQFEKEMTFAEYDEYKDGAKPVICECGEKAERTFIMDSLITHYKGTGFYQTDYGKGAFDIR